MRGVAAVNTLLELDRLAKIKNPLYKPDYCDPRGGSLMNLLLGTGVVLDISTQHQEDLVPPPSTQNGLMDKDLQQLCSFHYLPGFAQSTTAMRKGLHPIPEKSIVGLSVTLRRLHRLIANASALRLSLPHQAFPCPLGKWKETDILGEALQHILSLCPAFPLTTFGRACNEMRQSIVQRTNGKEKDATVVAVVGVLVGAHTQCLENVNNGVLLVNLNQNMNSIRFSSHRRIDLGTEPHLIFIPRLRKPREVVKTTQLLKCFVHCLTGSIKPFCVDKNLFQKFMGYFGHSCCRSAS